MFKACITYESCEGTHKDQVENLERKNIPGRYELISDENSHNDLKYIL
jgi:hypothetical protein